MSSRQDAARALGHGPRTRRRSRRLTLLAVAAVAVPLIGAPPASASTSAVYAWGMNRAGQLGDGTVDDGTATPQTVALPQGDTVSQLSAGDDHNLALAAGGTVYAWGLDGNGQLGDGMVADPNHAPAAQIVRLPAGVTVTQVDAGYRHSLALATDGTVYAWGDDARAQLGDGTAGGSSATPHEVDLPAGVAVTQVAAGGSHNLALADDGAVYAWGDDQEGQLGDGAAGGSSATPHEVDLPAGVTVTQVAAGGSHSLALADDGNVHVWGDDGWGQLGDDSGDGSDNFAATPQLVTRLAGVTITELAAGHGHTLALVDDGTVYAWGFNNAEQLGTDLDVSDPDPDGYVGVPRTVALPGGVTVTQVVAGGSHSMALTGGGGVYAWGYDGWGQLGDATSGDYAAPQAVRLPAGLAVTQLAAGGLHSLALATVEDPVPPGDGEDPEPPVDGEDPGAAGDVAFSSVTRTVSEAVGTTHLRVTRSGHTATPASVRFAHTSGTATSGIDFTLTPGTVTFAAGETSKSIPLTITDDTTGEGSETILVSLSAPSAGATLTSPSAIQVRVRASDQRPDALISTAPRSGYVGNDVYNLTAAGQTEVLPARRTRTRSFYVRVYNDGNVTNTFALSGSRVRAGSTVRYLSGTENVTPAMRSAGGLKGRLGPGAYKTLEVRVTVRAGAAIGSVKVAAVTATWTGDGTRRDRVRAAVKVTR